MRKLIVWIEDSEFTSEQELSMLNRIHHVVKALYAYDNVHIEMKEE